ncbi:hypothetical protein BH10PSE6_BH10PSE6_05040 [soil metagenome]
MTALAGKWTYRSFHNNPAPVTDSAETAFGLFFAEAEFMLADVSVGVIGGTIDWPGGGLDLAGSVTPPIDTSSLTFQIIGKGRVGTGTAGWEYQYHGHLAHQWPRGVNQIPALVGTVIRAKPHGAAAAGYVASFVAVERA